MVFEEEKEYVIRQIRLHSAIHLATQKKPTIAQLELLNAICEKDPVVSQVVQVYKARKSEPKFKGFKYWIKVSFRNLLKLKKEDVKTALAVIIGAMVK